MTCATRPSVHRSVSNPNASGPLRNAWSTASSSAADSRGRRPARPAPRSAAWPPWRQRRYQTLAACADTPKVWATSAWLAPWANMWAASRRRCSRPAKSRRQVPTLIGIADLPVRCPCLHTQHAGPKLHYQPTPRSSLGTDDADVVLGHQWLLEVGAEVVVVSRGRGREALDVGWAVGAEDPADLAEEVLEARRGDDRDRAGVVRSRIPEGVGDAARLADPGTRVGGELLLADQDADATFDEVGELVFGVVQVGGAQAAGFDGYLADGERAAGLVTGDLEGDVHAAERDLLAVVAWDRVPCRCCRCCLHRGLLSGCRLPAGRSPLIAHRSWRAAGVRRCELACGRDGMRLAEVSGTTLTCSSLPRTGSP